jgi:hypothetical protein
MMHWKNNFNSLEVEFKNLSHSKLCVEKELRVWGRGLGEDFEKLRGPQTLTSLSSCLGRCEHRQGSRGSLLTIHQQLLLNLTQNTLLCQLLLDDGRQHCGQ